MQQLGIAFGITLTASLLLFCILNLGLGVDDHVSEGVAGLPFIASHHVCEMLEREHARRAAPAKRAARIYSFEGYTISWKWATVYGSMTLFGVMQIASGYAGAVVALLNGSGEALVREMFPIVLPVVLVGNYLVGRTIGTRCATHAVATVLIVGLVGSGLARVFDFLLLSSDTFRMVVGEPKTIGTFLEAWLGGAALFWIPGLLGYWRGKRRMLSKYLTYLLGVLPADTRETLVGLAHSEAQALAAHNATTDMVRV